jgi:hypothetical protein
MAEAFADLEQRLIGVGATLVFPRADALADDVLAEIATPQRRWRRPLLVAAAVLLAVAAVVTAVPDSRHAVARWLGFESLRIEVVDRIPPEIEAALDEPPSDDVTVATLPGTLDAGSFRKLVLAGATVTPVDVGGRPGYWIEGEPHVFMYVDPDGDIREARLAANTLVWQDGDVVRRVEGDVALERALEIAEALPEGS